MSDKIEISPAIPWPAPFDVQKRIQKLRGYLDPKNPQYECEQQHVNIKAVIQLYEDGKIDGSEEVFIMEGKVVTEEEMLEGDAWAWVEGMGYEFAEKHAYGHGTLGNRYHEIRMSVRLTPQRGGDGTVYRIIVINDTGSNLLTLFDTDISSLGNFQGYTGWIGDAEVRDASGMVNTYRRLRVQVQLLRDDNSPWSDWINERAVVKPASQGVPRLSGYGIRKALYIGTAPGNHVLAVAATKGGMTSLPNGNEAIAHPLYLDAIKSALRRHQRLKKLVRFNLSEGLLLILKLVIWIIPSLGDL